MSFTGLCAARSISAPAANNYSKGKQLDYVLSSASSSSSSSDWSKFTPMEAGIINKVDDIFQVLLLRTMLQWEEQLRSEAGFEQSKLANVNQFGEIAVICWPDADDWNSYKGNHTINHPSQNLNLNLNLRFQFVDTLQATNSFDESLVIGEGRFGKVYKGTLPDGKTVAVKRGQKRHGKSRPEFVTEILIFSKLQHQRLVALIQYCDEKSEMILVYEYMEKGTLRDHLCGTNKDVDKLSWSQRLKICIGATQGLHYLHTGVKPRIIHGNVKSTNILLTENYIEKVADFGYLVGITTKKARLISKGVSEVLCARPAIDNTLSFEEANLAVWAIKQIKDGMVAKMVDPYLVDKINPNSLIKYLETVDRCLKNTGDERLSMIDVLWDEKYALKLQQVVVDNEAYKDSTMKTSLLSMSVIDRLPTKCNIDDSQVKENSVASYPSESQS